MVDTGAGKTCISQTAAVELSLKPLRLAKTYGAGGDYELEVVCARLTLRASGSDTAPGVSFETEARVIPLLEEGGAQIGLKSDELEIRLIGLLGRDLLRHAQVSYDGVGGGFQVSFDFTSLAASKSIKQCGGT